MNEFLKFLKSLLVKGFATKEEKEKLSKKYKGLDEDEQDTVKEDVEKAKKLPKEKKKDEAEEKETEKAVKSLMSKFADNIKGEAINEVKEEVKKWLTEQKTLIKSQAGIYNPEIKEKRGELNKKLRAYVYACLKQSEKLLKELTTDDTGSPYGGYTVDSELSAEIRHLITQYGVARREMLTVQLSKNSYKVNHLVTDVTVYWVDEGSAIGSTQPVLGQNELTLKKIGAIVTFTEELLEDSEIDLMSFVASRVAEGMAKKEDEAFFKGDGTSTYGSFTGLLKDSDIPAITMAGTTFASMDADDLIDLKDNVPESAQANGKFYMHRTNLSTVRKLKDSDNQYIYQRPSEKGPGTIWGDPIVTVEAMPARNASAAATAFVLYGDLKKGCIFGYKGAVKVKKFDSGVVKNVSDDGDINLITSDREAVRFTERVGYVQIFPSTNNPVTKLQTAAASA